MSSHFLPTDRFKQYDSPFETDNRLRYEGVKKSFNADLMATESCLKKCQQESNMSNTAFSNEETTCLRQCTLKYFDAQLLIENELTNFTRGISM